MPGHEGVDLPVPIGTPVRTIADGIVYMVYNSPTGHNYGKHIRIQHADGIRILYCHLDQIHVSVGQQVTSGMVIGLSGNTGNSTGPHLHLAFKKDNTTYIDKNGNIWPSNFVNPWSYIRHLYKPANRQFVTGFVYDYIVEGSDGEGVNFSSNLNLRTLPDGNATILGSVPSLSMIEITGAKTSGYYPVKVWAIPANNPSPAGIEMAPYFLPPTGNFGDICILKNNWSGGDERQQLQRSGDLSYVTKNQQWERRRIATTGIFLELDTSPGNNEYYTVEGTSWLPVHWNVGDEHTRTETVRFFSKGNCQPLSLPYTVTNKIRFNKLYPSWTSQGGVTLNNVIELQWLIAGQVEETYHFAIGKGLVGWSNRSGKKSWITEVIPVGQQENNTRESGCFS